MELFAFLLFGCGLGALSTLAGTELASTLSLFSYFFGLGVLVLLELALIKTFLGSSSTSSLYFLTKASTSLKELILLISPLNSKYPLTEVLIGL